MKLSYGIKSENLTCSRSRPISQNASKI